MHPAWLRCESLKYLDSSSIGATKGGVGKSTIATNLSAIAARDGKNVLLVDADIQGSSMAFRAIRERDDIKAFQITTPTLHKDLSQFKQDWIIVDAGGRDSGTFRSAIMASDILIIPCLPSSVDFWADDDVIEILKEARVYKDIEAYFILNQVIPNTKLATEIIEAMGSYNDHASLLKSRLHSRITYKNAFSEGKGVTETLDKKAAAEVKQLYNEIKNIIGE
jgi:chromosome partitioning protein